LDHQNQIVMAELPVFARRQMKLPSHEPTLSDRMLDGISDQETATVRAMRRFIRFGDPALRRPLNRVLVVDFYCECYYIYWCNFFIKVVRFNFK
jgi:hypothetical protein